jgi:hypothetical protein
MMIFKRLFCKHNLIWQYNIYGDLINILGGKRSMWKCTKCGKRELHDKLGGRYDEPKV